MNYMADVAKLFGLELGEKFKINSAGDISSDEYYKDKMYIGMEFDRHYTLGELGL